MQDIWIRYECGRTLLFPHRLSWRVTLVSRRSHRAAVPYLCCWSARVVAKPEKEIRKNNNHIRENNGNNNNDRKKAITDSAILFPASLSSLVTKPAYSAALSNSVWKLKKKVSAAWLIRKEKRTMEHINHAFPSFPYFSCFFVCFCGRGRRQTALVIKKDVFLFLFFCSLGHAW